MVGKPVRVTRPSREQHPGRRFHQCRPGRVSDCWKLSGRNRARYAESDSPSHCCGWATSILPCELCFFSFQSGVVLYDSNRLDNSPFNSSRCNPMPMCWRKSAINLTRHSCRGDAEATNSGALGLTMQQLANASAQRRATIAGTSQFKS